MEFLRLLLLFLHFVGLAALIGGFVTQITAAEKRVVPTMLHGAITQLFTGGPLIGVNEALDNDVNHPKLTVKLVVLLVILVLLWRNRRTASLGQGLFFLIGGLAVLNIGLAVFWT